jgi:hypothetical protein
MVYDSGDVKIVAEPHAVEIVSVVSALPKKNVNRLGKCGQKRKKDGAFLSNKLKISTRGAGNFLEYQSASIRIREVFFWSSRGEVHANRVDGARCLLPREHMSRACKESL